MILACTGCDSRYDVTGYPAGQQFRCRCGTVLRSDAPSPQAGLLACPHCGAGVAPNASACAHCTQQLLLKACPRCLSRVFHGHKHCPECGAELGVAAAAASESIERSRGTDRPCPRCEKQLHARLVGDIVVDECHGCQGLFLDHIAIQRVIMDRQQARAEALLGSLPKQTLDQIPPPGKMYIKCPVCRVVMNRKQFAAGAGVVIDVCKAHGTYFDVGELPKIIEFVINGGLEKAEKREIARLREAAKREQANAQFAQTMASRSSTHAVEHQRGSALVELLGSIWR